MNAPMAPKRSDYEPIVRTFCPAAEGEELEMRASLLMMRDQAMAAKSFCCAEAWPLLDYVETTGRELAFKAMKLEELKELRRVLVMVVANASAIEAVFAPQLDLRGANARG